MKGVVNYSVNYVGTLEVGCSVLVLEMVVDGYTEGVLEMAVVDYN